MLKSILLASCFIVLLVTAEIGKSIQIYHSHSFHYQSLNSQPLTGGTEEPAPQGNPETMVESSTSDPYIYFNFPVKEDPENDEQDNRAMMGTYLYKRRKG